MGKRNIIDLVVDGGPAYKIVAHCSFGQHVIDKLRKYRNSTRPALVADVFGIKYQKSVACFVSGGNLYYGRNFINAETGDEVSYEQLLQETINVATGLREMGVKKGDVIGFCSESRPEYIASVVAAACCGAIVTTANVLYTPDEIKHVLNISQPSIMFCSEAVLQHKYDLLKSLPFIKTLLQYNGTPVKAGVISYSDVLINGDIEKFEAEPVKGRTDTVFLLYSSGTTGYPKGVMLTHLNALYELAIVENDTALYDEAYSMYLTVVPWYHGYGLMTTINYMICNRTMVYLTAFNPEKYLNAIQKYKINVLLAVPPIAVFIAKSVQVENYDMSSIRLVWCAAAPLSPETIELALKRMPNCNGILQAYGLTETSTAATRDVFQENTKSFGKLGSGGLPVGGVKAIVVDIETRQKLGAYEKGEICLSGPVLMKGYAGNAAATKEAFEGGFLKTGDIGYYDEDGYIFVVDRLKEIIKYKGHQVSPAEVESVMLQHPAVAECGVVGAPDEAAGELPTAFVVLKPGLDVDPRELIDFAAERLSPAKRLHGGVMLVADIPKNPSGKILRRLLKQKLLSPLSKL